MTITVEPEVGIPLPESATKIKLADRISKETGKNIEVGAMAKTSNGQFILPSVVTTSVPTPGPQPYEQLPSSSQVVVRDSP